MEIIAFLLHLLLDFLLGWGVLGLTGPRRRKQSDMFTAILLGFLLETTAVFLLLLMGLGVKIAFPIVIVLAILLHSKTILQIIKQPSQWAQHIPIQLPVWTGVKWYSWLLIVLLVQKLGFIFWQLMRMPTFFSDTIKHWSTQARAIYSGANFSLNSADNEFLGSQLQLVLDYPLQLPIWRANSAILNGGWNEFVSRSDGLLFFILICGIVGMAIWRLSQRRWMALGAAYWVASLPLQVWHGAAGYADIAVEAYLLAATACLIRKQWLLCGMMMAGAAWAKNDGLALYLPGILMAIGAYLFFVRELKVGQEMREMSYFFLGYMLVLPWLIFQFMYFDSPISKMLGPIKRLFSSHASALDDVATVLPQAGPATEANPPSYQLFWDYVLVGPTSGLFWMFLLIGLLLVGKRMLKDNIGRSLLLFFVSTSGIIFYIFTYTPAYEYLLIQTTIHRTMLQFSASAVLVLGYGLHLKLMDSKLLIPPK